MSELEESALLIGIGSPHGDDRAGWEVADRLEMRLTQENAGIRERIAVRKASTPHDILDWLKPGLATHIIDASHDPVSQLHACRWELLPESFSKLCAGSTHRLDLISVLRIAEVLTRLPKQLTLWTLPIAPARLMAQSTNLSPSTEALVQECVERLWCVSSMPSRNLRRLLDQSEFGQIAK